MPLSHIDESGRARMVDVSNKSITSRTATASAFVKLSAAALQAISDRTTPKGDPFEAARIAGIMAAKRTAELIPLCHPLPLHHCDVRLQPGPEGISIEATASTDAKTGVEMEALTAASVAALTIYDMCKAVDKGMVITDLRLEYKSGGRSGEYRRSEDPA